MSAFSVGQLSVQPASPLPSETAIKEYLMWMPEIEGDTERTKRMLYHHGVPSQRMLF